MAETTNLHLKKPAYEDPADIKDINDNMDTLDGVVSGLLDSVGTVPSGKTVQGQIDAANDDIDSIEYSIGTLPEGETVVSQLATKIDKPTAEGTNDQILRSNGDGTTRWDDAATSTEIGNAVTAWLDDNIPTGTTVVVDPTLSIQNAAADSKTIGDRVSFDEYLLNEGLYQIKASDLESGQWSFSTKAANAARARTKFLIPVRAGMVITYSNTTFDTYFNVLETPTSQSYITNIGWKTDGNGVIQITVDGYLAFIIRNHSNTSATVNPADYNSTVIIKTEAKQFDDSLRFVPVDLISGGNRKNTTDAGITFTWNADKTACTVNGTVSGNVPAAQYFNGSTTAFPEGLEAGKTYYAKANSTTHVAGLGLYYYKNGSYNSAKFINADTVVTIPSDTTGLLVFIYVLSGETASNDVVSDFGIFEYEPNAMLSDKISQIGTVTIKSIENGSYPLLFENKSINSNENQTFAISINHIATDYMYFDNRFLMIEIDDGYIGSVFSRDQNNTGISRPLRAGRHFFYAGSAVPVSFQLVKTPTGRIYPEESIHMKVSEVDLETKTEIGCGIYEHKLLFDVNGSISKNYLYYYTSNAEISTVPIKIPKSGLRIGYNDKYHSKEYIDGATFSFPQFRIVAVKKGNNGLALQTDDEDILAVSQSETRFPYSIYIPHIEDCYIIIVQDRPDCMDALYVTSGEVDRSFCGVYNIFPTALRVIDNEEENTLDILGYQSDWYSYSSMLYYATVLRLRDVRKIVCSPKYTLLAEIYKINTDGSISRHSDVWGTWYGSEQSESQINTSGLSVIDFSKYDFDGFALVAIQSTIKYVEADSVYGYTIRKMTTGNLGGYEDVARSVCVDYKNGVTVSKVPGLPSIMEENIHRLMNWKVPVYESGYYVEQHSTTPHYFPTQYDCVPSMYAGTYVANSLFMQVTAKSALTCLKNRNGRMRKMQRVQASQGTPTDGTIAFGLTCTNFASVIRGLKENYECTSYVFQDKKKFDTYDFDYKHDLDKLRPGDALIKHIETPELGRATNSHCMTVESIIEVNGVIKAVNIIEAGIPYCRRVTYLDEEYYMSNSNWIVKMYTIDKLADYKWINRIKPEYLKPITQTFDMYPASTDVGTVMCDRGTDSIYGCHTKYIELSFKDDDVTTNLYVYKDGTLTATVPKSGASTVNGLQLINIYSSLPKITYYNDATDPNHEHPLYKLYEGLYTVKTDKSNAVQETFYVKGDIDPITYTEDEETTTLTIPNFSNFIWMEVWNSIPTLPDETEEQTAHRLATRRCRTYTVDDFLPEDIDTEHDTAVIHIPRYQYNYQEEQEDISGISRVYETQYGTYWASINGRVSSDYYSLD